ncbi:uncharacterized protein LOC122234354 isoform X3 [Panthera tigris]|uniref:uncharacterized protein LOC122234354 isoform X3 n=1 Tax=Panthera tigris TaxID=9694 RepID=UPI001C6F90C1|nr:uncharacterized protein LOC122234354 isoform X3 [Panthera tigris]
MRTGEERALRAAEGRNLSAGKLARLRKSAGPMRNRAGLGVRKVPAGAESWGGASGGACPAPPPWLARHRAAGRRRWSGGLSFCPGCGGRRRCLRERRGRVRGCGLSPAALSLAHRLPLQVRRLDPRLRHCGESCRSGACPADQGAARHGIQLPNQHFCRGSHLIKPSFPSSPCGSETTGPEAHGAHRVSWVRGGRLPDLAEKGGDSWRCGRRGPLRSNLHAQRGAQTYHPEIKSHVLF